MYSSQAIQRDTNLLFPSSFKHSDGEYSKTRELMMNSDLYQQQSSGGGGGGLARYRSAPCSFFATLLEGDDGCDDFLNSDSDAMFARFANGAGESEPQDLQFPSAVVKHEEPEPSLTQNEFSGSSSSTTQMVYQSSMDHRNLGNQSSNSASTQTVMDGLFKVPTSVSMENPAQGKSAAGNLLRQSSSPAGFFANLTAENGFGVTRDAGDYRVGYGTNGSSSNRLSSHMNLPSRTSPMTLMPQIAENVNESSDLEDGNTGNANSTGNGFYLSSNFQNDSGFAGIKRKRDGDEKFSSGYNTLESQNQDSRAYNTNGLTHHLSLPKTTAEMAAVEKFLQFQQDSTPCKIRAKRGFATHPRSIAERVRRTRISERMRKLQELFPNMDKQTNTADMLDLAVEYIKDLQKDVKTLTDIKANCTCLSKQR